MAHTRQSRLDSGVDFEVKVLTVIPFRLKLGIVVTLKSRSDLVPSYTSILGDVWLWVGVPSALVVPLPEKPRRHPQVRLRPVTWKPRPESG